jgi:hypothetical protein
VAEELFHFIVARKQREATERGERKLCPRRHTPVTYFLQPGRKLYLLPIIFSHFESTIELNYPFGHNPHDQSSLKISLQTHPQVFLNPSKINHHKSTPCQVDTQTPIHKP